MSGAWVKQGSDINGESDNDNSGYSVSLSSDGLSLAIGAPGNDGPGGAYENYGQVRIYKLISGSWVKQGNDIDGENGSDASGWSVSLNSDGSTVAIGSPHNIGRGSTSFAHQGQARVYKFISGAWSQQGGDIDGTVDNEQLGLSVSINTDGTSIIVGGIKSKIYKYLSGSWTQQGTTIDTCGFSVAISHNADTIATSTPGANGGGIARGRVRVYYIGSSTPSPEIEVRGNSTNISNGDNFASISDHTFFGHISTITTKTFRIYNTGTAVLNLTGSPIVKLTGLDAADFNVVTMPTNTINPGDFTTFTIEFTPGTSGVKKAIVKINCNDGDENPFSFAIQANNFNCIESDLILKQIGSKIKGQVSNDLTGYSVSLSADGSIVAVGSPQSGGSDTSAITNRGQIGTYKLVSGLWTSYTPNISGLTDGDFFGYSVSLNDAGNILAVGAPLSIGGGSSSTNARGQVLVYNFSSGIWSQLGSSIYGENDGDFSGLSVSLSKDGSTVAIGSHLSAGGGVVRIYRLISNVWTKLGSDIIANNSGDRFGKSVSLNWDGNILVIGAPFGSGGGTKCGYSKIYQFNGSVWSQIGTDINGESDHDYSGSSVCLNYEGNIFAIGAGGTVTQGSNRRGQVRVFKFIGSTWSQIGSNILGEDSFDLSDKVSLSNDGFVLAIGGLGNKGSGLNRGHVRVFEYNGTSWIKRNNDIEGDSNNDRLGVSVSLSADGGKLAIGTDKYFGGIGYAKIYEYNCSIATSLNYELNTHNNFPILVYPNAFKETIQLDNSSFKENELVEILIINSTGQIVYKDCIYPKYKSINLEKLSSGIYFLYIQSNSLKENVIIIKQ